MDLQKFNELSFLISDLNSENKRHGDPLYRVSNYCDNGFYSLTLVIDGMMFCLDVAELMRWSLDSNVSVCINHFNDFTTLCFR